MRGKWDRGVRNQGGFHTKSEKFRVWSLKRDEGNSMGRRHRVLVTGS